MRELYALVFSVCMVLIGTEMIVRLFPEKSGSLIHALAALMLLVVLVNGILKLQSGVSLDFDLTETGESLNRTQTDGDTQKTYILVKAADGSQKPLIVTKTEPEIRGVVVVSRGGGDPKMREKIVEAVKTALDLSSTQVCVVGYSEYTYGNE